MNPSSQHGLRRRIGVSAVQPGCGAPSASTPRIGAAWTAWWTASKSAMTLIFYVLFEFWPRVFQLQDGDVDVLFNGVGLRTEVDRSCGGHRNTESQFINRL